MLPALSSMQTISLPQISQVYLLPFSTFLAFVDVFLAFGFTDFGSAVLARILFLSFHQDEDPPDFEAVLLDFDFFATGFFAIELPPLYYYNCFIVH
jgi:hypothetical protein